MIAGYHQAFNFHWRLVVVMELVFFGPLRDSLSVRELDFIGDYLVKNAYSRRNHYLLLESHRLQLLGCLKAVSNFTGLPVNPVT